MATTTELLNINCVLVTGGGGGIGKAIAKYFVALGKKVVIAGRTEYKLKETVKEIGASGYYVLNTGVPSQIASSIKKITIEYPDLDCLVNNAGIQRQLDVLQEEDFLTKADQEIDINIRGPMHLTVGLLPHLQTKSNALIINVSSILGFCPFVLTTPVYNGTKAWVHYWTMNLRTQLSKAGSNIHIVEVVPPTVETDLHRERSDPNDNKKENNPNALSVEEFMNDFATKLERGDNIIAAGEADEEVKKWYDAYATRVNSEK